MHYSIIKKSQCEKYDFGHFLFSPRFFLQDKLTYWDTLETQANGTISDYFFHVKDTINEIDDEVICYDLTDALLKFLTDGIQTNHIGSTKKVAQKGDFVISRLRSYLEQMAIVEERELEQLFSSEFLVFRKKTDQLSTYTFFALCMTKIVQTILKRGQYGTEHPRFYDFLLTNLPVPACLLVIDPYVKRTIQKALAIRKKSKDFYAQAQDFLVTELGFADWQPKHQLTFFKNFSDTKDAERIDAGYFQPKYEKIEKKIENYSDRPTKIRDEFEQNKSTFEVDPEKLYRYVEIGSVNVSTGEIVAEEILGKDLPANAKRVLEKGDIIVSKVRTYRGAITIVQEDGYVGSGAFCVLRENGQINKETLLTCLRSKFFLTWSWKPNTGTSYPTLNDDDILDFPIPFLSKEKQTEIEQKVDESFNLRKRAKDLLEHAKCAVEIAIEQGEQPAIDSLESVVEML